jgi:hypothetical protein
MNELSRRSVLRGGAILGVSTVGVSALGATAALGSVRSAGAATAAKAAAGPAGRHLVPDYQPPKPTGWSAMRGQKVGMTLGGHVPSKVFTQGGHDYKISLLPFDQAGDAPDPVYVPVPADPTLAYQKTLQDAYGEHYTFRYTDGFRGADELRVQSYGVFAIPPADPHGGTNFGGGIYVEYQPDPGHGDPRIGPALHWIQVATFQGMGGGPASVDCSDRANPFYDIGGLTNVYGHDVFNFGDVSQADVAGTEALDRSFFAEVMLAHDTGTKDASGRTIITLHGGFKWGWQVKTVTS